MHGLKGNRMEIKPPKRNHENTNYMEGQFSLYMNPRNKTASKDRFGHKRYMQVQNIAEIFKRNLEKQVKK